MYELEKSAIRQADSNEIDHFVMPITAAAAVGRQHDGVDLGR
jgi:hypothetical protein